MKKISHSSPPQKVAALPRQSRTSAKSKVKRAVVHVAPVRAAQSTGVLLHRIVAILETARGRVVRVVNSEMVLAYWQIGREIVEHLQAGARRAEYGEELLETLAAELNRRFGRGFSATNLRYFRLFYQVFADRDPQIRHEPRDESAAQHRIHHEPRDEFGVRDHKRRKPRRVSRDLAMAVAARADLRGFSDRLGWTHYRTLTKVAHEAARRFYEIEAEREGWSATHLERQIHTHLFARLLKSRNRQGVLDLAARGQVIERPVDLLVNPYVLDFLDLPDSEGVHKNGLRIGSHRCGSKVLKSRHRSVESLLRTQALSLLCPVCEGRLGFPAWSPFPFCPRISRGSIDQRPFLRPTSPSMRRSTATTADSEGDT